MNPFISIIMPVYNSANQVETAISSIVAQSMSNWELLVIDDSSTDHTVDIVDKWTHKDQRITLIKLETNSGPGHAKNIGLNRAAGKYVTFCDSDDWIDKDAFAILSSDEKEDSDVVVAGYYRDICDSKNNVLESNSVQMQTWYCDQKKDVIRSIAVLDQKRLFSFAVNKLYKTELIKKKNICFSDKKFGEDYDFNISFFAHCSSIRVLDKSFYHYIKQNNESLTERFIPDFYEINRDRFEKMCKLIDEFGCYSGQTRAIIMNLYIKHVLAAIARLYDKRGGISKHERYIRVKSMLNDKMSIEAVKYARSTRISERICNIVFKTRLVFANLLFGHILWFMQTRGKKIYERIK